MNVVEVIRWGVLAAVDRALENPDTWRSTLAVFGDACIDPEAERSAPLVHYMVSKGYQRAESGALPLLAMIQLLDDDASFDVQEPPGGLLLSVPEELMRWAEDNLTLRADGSLWSSGDTDTAFCGAALMLIRRILHEDPDEWRARLSGDRARDETYSHLCIALLTGIAFAQQQIPPWMPEDELTDLVRASWAGEDALHNAASATLYARGLAVIPVVLADEKGIWLRAHARRKIVLAELARRGWGSDVAKLRPEQALELAQWMDQDPAWIRAGEEG